MKKVVSVEKSFCDVCGQEASGYTNCDHCGKEFCYECGKRDLKKYPHAVHFSGSGDGHYCPECDALLTSNGDAKHAAYRKIATLRNEQAGWHQDFKKRASDAEQALTRLAK